MEGTLIGLDQTVINWILAGIGGTIGFLLRILWQTVTRLREADERLVDKVAKIEVLVAGEYVRRYDFDKMMGAHFKKLDRIEEKLSAKADKGVGSLWTGS